MARDFSLPRFFLSVCQVVALMADWVPIFLEDSLTVIQFVRANHPDLRAFAQLSDDTIYELLSLAARRISPGNCPSLK